ncbi:Hsp20 family protein [Gluconacetobacter azotocaptans]|uniref:Hsp20 family protein n=1 Tax=Gluconacetobacter azotocaptans TaxID=142834 RepID=A0A7W4JVM5_9PROT|nr:Hsp20 family protein [Gluconacetobacter azotocaptans]MBB2191756.1 Hsp20 family protein [Gluconacetobacter azotocaptans]MBM9400978.1 Hsp20 family protein [Gluconacetobacter azotocaptans]GBQ34151.1 heat shock protein Hsp20 [Gluconacetobacter azotocaptans DSM 13594]
MTYDFAPLFRTAIGFDRLARLVDNAAQSASAPSYPPYNIERVGDDSYVLTMAVAGFGSDDIELTVQDNTLIVAGRVGHIPPAGEILHRGIATRAFERRFVLADHILVEGADLTNGLLRITIRRFIPEAMKPRRITVTSGVPLPASADAAQVAPPVAPAANDGAGVTGQTEHAA